MPDASEIRGIGLHAFLKSEDHDEPENTTNDQQQVMYGRGRGKGEVIDVTPEESEG